MNLIIRKHTESETMKKESKKITENEETEELGSKAKELMKSENLRGPFDSVQAFMKSLWDEDD